MFVMFIGWLLVTIGSIIAYLYIKWRSEEILIKNIKYQLGVNRISFTIYNNGDTIQILNASLEIKFKKMTYFHSMQII